MSVSCEDGLPLSATLAGPTTTVEGRIMPGMSSTLPLCPPCHGGVAEDDGGGDCCEERGVLALVLRTTPSIHLR
jgi:hypothetical protein